MSLLSVIVPCLNEEAAIPFFYDAMKKVEEEFAAALAKGELDTSMLFAGHPELAERASRNPVALHKRNNIRSAIRRGLMTT